MKIKKFNRERRLEAEKRAEIVHLPPFTTDRKESRKKYNRRIAELVKKARKRG